ncbi:hypothetical protein N7481_004979 [Penicillium waksmanii]|uniref:uncharacterized protein n=1 Tax=Penicillium waksmanii TaxID=69791 RepID=UPI0025487B73|nr:uncharacterized protein N7481_004979 [Penicillium waksmanii]KAJ5982880.1 hypothetical protein N7481_004979 [Penicillium waksmanii]
MGYGGKTFRVDRSGSSFDLRSSKYSKCQGILRDILRAEQDLRELVQLEETLQHRVIAFKKASYIEPDATQIEKIEKQLEETQAKYARKAHDLYECEISIPMELKDAYDSLRHNPKWFMREGMVKDCSQRGGCCSRARVTAPLSAGAASAIERSNSQMKTKDI